MESGVPILLYHDIRSPELPCEKSGLAARDTVVHGDIFEGQLRSLHEAGYRSITLDSYLKTRKIASPEGKRVILSFDDGHVSNYRLALPLLRKFGFTAVFFIVADWVGSPHYMDEDDIRRLADAGMEIGSHGLTHSYLPLLDDGGVERELVESRERLESITGQEVVFFAFPGGHHDKRVITGLKRWGYRGACSCLQGLNTPAVDPFCLKRIEIRKRSSVEDFTTLFDPGQIFFYGAVDGFKDLFRKTLGLETYTRMRSRFYRFYPFKR